MRTRSPEDPADDGIPPMDWRPEFVDYLYVTG
jgi:hypothetical protein